MTGVVRVAMGKVLRFDPVRGYGFIVPDSGGEDVFLHANDLLDEKHLIKTGTIVEFDVEAGERGLKACGVQIRSGAAVPGAVMRPATPTPLSTMPGYPAPFPTPPPTPAMRAKSDRSVDDSDEGVCDVLSSKDLQLEVTELLLDLEPSLTGRQILAVRARFTGLAMSHGWVED